MKKKSNQNGGTEGMRLMNNVPPLLLFKFAAVLFKLQLVLEDHLLFVQYLLFLFLELLRRKSRARPYGSRLSGGEMRR